MRPFAFSPPRCAIVGLPLQSDPGDREEFVRNLLAQSDWPDKQNIRTFIETVSSELFDLGYRILGSTAEPPGAGLSLVLAVRELSPPRDRPTSAPAVLEGLRGDIAGRRPHADTRAIELPCGPAVLSLIFGQFDLPPEETDAEHTTTISTFRAEFLVPTPEWDGMVVLDVSTTDEDAWPEVSMEAVRMARSLRFLDDGEPAREGEHLLRL